MKLPDIFAAAYLILPQFVLGLVLLAPPDDQPVDGNNSNVERVDLDDSLLQLPWTVPMSNLERAVLSLDDDNGTLIKDLIRHQKKKPPHGGRSRHHKASPFKRPSLEEGEEEEVGQGHLDEPTAGPPPRHTRDPRPPSSDAAPGATSGDAASQMSRLVDLVSRSLRDRFEPSGDESASTTSSSPDPSPPSNRQRQPSRVGSHSPELGSGFLQRLPDSTQGLNVASTQGESHHNNTLSSSSSSSSSSSPSSPPQGEHHHSTPSSSSSLSSSHRRYNVSQVQTTTARKSGAESVVSTRRGRRWAPIKVSHQIKIGAGLPRLVITRKRQRVNAKVGVLVVVDNSIYRQYLLDNGGDPKVALARIRRYYGMVFAMIDQRYTTIDDPHLTISVRISGILVAERREDSGWLEQIVDWSTVATHGMASVYTDRALKKFTKWLTGRRHLPEFDHAMVFTSYRLTVKQGISLGGMAYLNAVCDRTSSVSIVADRGDFQCVKVATHELAHSLGAQHDGDKTAKSCPPSGNYVMSPNPSHERQVLKNAFHFSPCSVRDMSYHLSKPSSSCVKSDPPVYYSYDLKRLPPGHLYTADMQCKLIFGKKSGFCTEAVVQDVMCGQLWCKDPHKPLACRTNSYLTALPGTECGVNKVCSLGECILDPAKNAINSASPQIRIVPNRSRQMDLPSFRLKGPGTGHRADEKRVRHRVRQEERCKADQNQKYCQGLLAVNPNACTRRAVQQYCCQTCSRFKLN